MPPPKVPAGVVYTSLFIAAGMTGLVGYTAYEVYIVGKRSPKVRRPDRGPRF